MGLTRDEITAGGTYAVQFEHGRLSLKRFNDAKDLIKRISRYEGSSSAFDGGTKTWTVVLAADADGALRDLRTAAESYDAIVTRTDDEGRAALEAERRELLARVAEIDKLLKKGE